MDAKLLHEGIGIAGGNLARRSTILRPRRNPNPCYRQPKKVTSLLVFGHLVRYSEHGYISSSLAIGCEGNNPGELRQGKGEVCASCVKRGRGHFATGDLAISGWRPVAKDPRLLRRFGAGRSERLAFGGVDDANPAGD